VKFEVIGDIEQVETIAAGPSVKVRAFLRKVYGAVGGGSGRGSRLSASRMEISVEWSYIGTKPMASGNGT
jgi:hypothetical protein